MEAIHGLQYREIMEFQVLVCGITGGCIMARPMAGYQCICHYSTISQVVRQSILPC